MKTSVDVICGNEIVTFENHGGAIEHLKEEDLVCDCLPGGMSQIIEPLSENCYTVRGYAGVKEGK